MKAYVGATGIIFGLIVLAHVLRLVAEGPRVVADPWFIGLTVLAAALCIWAWRLLRVANRR